MSQAIVVSRSSLGKPFQNFRAAMANDLSPNVVFDSILGTCSNVFSLFP